MKNRIISLLLSMVLVVTCFAPNVFAADETGVEGFVERLYTIALNRASEPDGKAFWVKQLKDKTMTGAEVAHGLPMLTFLTVSMLQGFTKRLWIESLKMTALISGQQVFSVEL